MSTNTTALQTAVSFRNDTRRQRAYELFVSTLPTRATVSDTAFRKNILNTLQTEFNMSVASAAATYNIVKHAATTAGLCEQFGRDPETRKLQARAPKIELGMVNVVRAKDGAIVAQGVARKQAEEMLAKAIAQKKAKLEIA